MTAAAPTTVFLRLVPATGYWIGVADHACADPEYIHVPARIELAATADYCPGVDSDTPWIADLCPTCQEKDTLLPF